MSRMERVHAALYVALICVFVASGALFFRSFSTSEKFWERFTLAYLGALVVYTWYLFALLLVHDVKPRRYQAYGGGKIAVLIPCYNEEPDLVEESIRAVLAAEGNKQVIVIDDGSTNGVQTRLRELARELPITLHEFARERRQARGAASTRRSTCSTTTSSTSSRSTATRCSSRTRSCASSSRCSIRRSARRPATCCS